MSYNHLLLKNNLRRILKERSLKIVDLESKMKKKTGSIGNILRESNTNPSIEVIKSIADAINIDINELLTEDIIEDKVKIELLLDVNIHVIKEITPLIDKYNIKLSDITRCIKEAYKYSNDFNLLRADQNFINWLIREKYK